MDLKKLLVLCILLACTIYCHAKWTPLIENYSRNDYKAGSQNWQIIQQSNSWMYFANKTGMLEFNGSEWYLYSLNNKTDVRSILGSKDNKKIYIGGVNEFGYLEPGSNGRLRYHCLSDSLMPQLALGNIWTIYEIDNAIYFCADRSVVKYTDNQLLVTIPGPDKIDCSNLIDNTLYLGTPSGMYVLAGESFFPLRNADILKKKKLRAFCPMGGKILIATALDGLYIYDGQSVTPFSTEIDTFLKNNEIFSMTISGSKIAIGTVLKGAVIFDTTGKVLDYCNESNGLQNNTILSVFFDRDDNLWLGLDNGIACIAMNYPITYLYNAPNFYGSGYAAALYHGKLYLGTNRGLYTIPWPVPLTENAPELSLVKELQGQVWGLYNICGTLFCCLDKGLYYIDNDQFHQVLHSGAWSVKPMRDNPGKLWVAAYDGFSIMEKEQEQWQPPKPIDSFSGSIINYAEGTIPGLFLRNSWKETFHLILNKDLTEVTRTVHYGPEKQLPLDAYIFNVNDTIRWTGSNGIYKMSPDDDFISDTYLNTILETSNKNYYTYLQQQNKKLWALGPAQVSLYDFNTGKLSQTQHNIPLVTNFENLFPVGDSSVIINNEKGFALWEPFALPNDKREGVLQILKVVTTKPQDSILYLNSFYKQNEIPEIKYRNNSLRFFFDLIVHPKREGALFQYRLDDDAWSNLTPSGSKDFSDLSIGQHVFSVKTELNDGTILTDKYIFEILPPWYRTIWAYTIYTLLLILFLFGVWRWDDKRLKKKKQQLELEQHQKIQAKEQVFLEETERKEREIVQLKNEHLEMEVKHKNQELANIAINLARKNEILIEIKDDLFNVSKEIRTEDINITSLRRKILRLNNKIDENIIQDDNFKKFEEHFDLVHNNFTQRLFEKYPSLTISERKMCAFIKMQLSSKEIAPLLNISLRGVETLRYRLRKKIGLYRDESLTQFLNNF